MWHVDFLLGSSFKFQLTFRIDEYILYQLVFNLFNEHITFYLVEKLIPEVVCSVRRCKMSSYVVTYTDRVNIKN